MFSSTKNLKFRSGNYNLFLLLFACFFPLNLWSIEPTPDSTYSWYFEEKTPYVYNIRMLSDSTGYATTSGQGNNISGHVLKYSNKKWYSTQQYDYSDFPALFVSNEQDQPQVFAINHLTHNGDYKPVMKYFNGRNWSAMSLPKIMWDDTDYAMFFVMAGNSYNNVWGAGQKGNIIHFNGHNWRKVSSPLEWKSEQNYYEADIFNIFVINDKEAWACAYGGKILHYTKGKWVVDTVFENMPDSRFYDINFLDENFGIAVGENGAIAVYKNGIWTIDYLNKDWKFYSVKIFQKGDFWIGGSDGGNSLLLHNFEDRLTVSASLSTLKAGTIFDFDGFEVKGEYKFWLATIKGILTNRAEKTITFSDVTLEANLPVRGRGGIFFDIDNDDDSDLMILSEGNTPYRGYINDGKGNFSDMNFPMGIKPLDDISGGLIFGDVENDGKVEILLTDEENRLMLMNQAENLQFVKIETALPEIKLSIDVWSTLKFWDINKDNYIDIFWGNESDGLNVILNNGYGEFVTILELGIPIKSGKKLLGITLYDVNVDGLTDILLVYNSGINELWLNKNNYQFDNSNYNSIQGFIGDDSFMGIFSDFNNDRWPDLFVYKRKTILPILNNLQPRKKEFAPGPNIGKIYHYYWETGMVTAGDINHDYFNDLYVSNSLWMNQKGKFFENISEVAQISFEGNSTFEDIDNDGDLDIFFGNLSKASGLTKNIFLYKNNLEDKKSIKLKFECYNNNRFGIGSWLWIYETADDTKNDYLCASKYVGFEGNPLLSENIFPLTIPVKANKKYRALIRFPDGTEKEIPGIVPGNTYTISDNSFPARMIAIFNWNFLFSFKNANVILEISKLIIFIFCMLWLLFKFRHVIKLQMRWKIFLGSGLFILYFVHFVFSGLHPFSLDNLGSYSTIILVITAAPYLSALILEKHRLQRISHYKILNLIGEGGMGKVYKARSTKTNQIVALKILNRGVTESEDGMIRFQRESKIGIEMANKNIVRFYETGEQEGQCYLAMEYLKGQTLKDQIRSAENFSAPKIVRISIDILNALSEIHKKNIVHRDVKSENIFITTGQQVKLMDFGLAKSAIFTAATKTNEILGTLAYMSPQQAVGETVDRRSDIYSLGVIMYELATGKLPFSGEHDMAVIFEIFKSKQSSIRHFKPDFPPELEKCIFKAMAKELENRYSNDADFIKDLKNLKL